MEIYGINNSCNIRTNRNDMKFWQYLDIDYQVHLIHEHVDSRILLVY